MVVSGITYEHNLCKQSYSIPSVPTQSLPGTMIRRPHYLHWLELRAIAALVGTLKVFGQLFSSHDILSWSYFFYLVFSQETN